MESFSGDTEESTEDIPGEIIGYVVLHKRVMVRQAFGKDQLSKEKEFVSVILEHVTNTHQGPFIVNNRS